MVGEKNVWESWNWSRRIIKKQLADIKPDSGSKKIRLFLYFILSLRWMSPTKKKADANQIVCLKDIRQTETGIIIFTWKENIKKKNDNNNRGCNLCTF